MQFRPELKRAKLIRRYKRFLADVELDGELVTVHCPNTGSMKNCIVPGSDCWLSESDNPKRKYSYTWELATTHCGGIACINTQRANQVIAEAIDDNRIPGLIDKHVAREVKREVPYAEKHRIDFWLNAAGRQTFIEVKSVTLSYGEGLGAFPDAVSKRASAHLQALMACVDQGHRAFLVYCVQHSDIKTVRPADDIDPSYGQLLREALDAGVQVRALGCDVSAKGVSVNREVDIEY